MEATSFVFKVPPSVPVKEAAVPLDLTASDGTGLILVSLEARVVVEAPLAFTELHLVFRNPEPRQLEGRFRIALPSTASISRFAMWMGSGWQEGEVVERQAAQQAYEDFLHRRQDPALLEHEAGNEFSARVFPIEAHACKELILSFSQEMPARDAIYRLPLLGLPRLGSLRIRALVGQSAAVAIPSSMGSRTTRWEVVEASRDDWVPDVDFEVQPPASGRDGLRQGNIAVLRVAPELPTMSDEVPSLLLLMDTSASRALGHARQVALASELILGLAEGAGPDTPLAVATFDNAPNLVFEGAAGAFGAAQVRLILDRMALGASDIHAALSWARSLKGRYARVLVLTDGVATAGETGTDRIVEAVRALADVGVERLDVVAVGGLRDDAALRRLVTAGLPRDGTVCDGDTAATEIAARLTRSTRSGIRVEVPGAGWVWPNRLDGVQPGDTALVYVDIPEHRPLKLLLNGDPQPDPVLAPAERALLERAWVKARIEKLEDQRARMGDDPDMQEGMRRQVIELSTRHRVLSPYTALLVLETEADYARFKIDRRALSDILSVGMSGIEVLRRESIIPPTAPPVKPVVPLPVEVVEGGFPEGVPPSEEPVPEARPEPDGFTGAAPPMDDAPMMGSGASAPMMEVAEMSSMMADSAMEADLSVRDLDRESPRRSRRVMAAPPPSVASAQEQPSAPPPPMSASPQRIAPEPAPPSVAGPVASPSPIPRPVPSDGARPVGAPPRPAPHGSLPISTGISAWNGPFHEVMSLVLGGRSRAALERAVAWRQSAPGDILALVALGTAAEILEDWDLAARAYASLVDLFPSRADLRRFAGELLERISRPDALRLAIDTYRQAVLQRPDHPAGHHLLGMALLKGNLASEAFAAIAEGQSRSYPPRFPGVDRILAEDLGLVAAALIKAEPERRHEVMASLRRAGAHLEDAPSLRFVLVWETDANDVDFHIHDALGGHACYREKILPSGGELYADITQGYGPECFTIRLPGTARAYPYKLQAHYFRRGPMGYGMGKLQIIEHDGKGGLGFDERPYVVMEDGAFVDMGVVSQALETR